MKLGLVLEGGGMRGLFTAGVLDAKMQSLGFARNVVVLTQPAGYRKEPARLWPMHPFLRKLPAVEEALRRRPGEYNRAVDFVEAEEAKGAAFVFRPPAKLPIGRLSRSRRAVQAAYDIGSAEVCPRWPLVPSGGRGRPISSIASRCRLRRWSSGLADQGSNAWNGTTRTVPSGTS